jgi:hypothetical protein
MALNVNRELARLKETPVIELKERYLTLFGEPARTGNKDFLVKRIIWRIQSMSEGTLSQRALCRAEELANEADLRTTIPKPSHAPPPTSRMITVPLRSAGEARLPTAGTVLTRHYKGRLIQVTVRPDGFDYEGEVYTSLSAVAKAVTGSHWNGYGFFGLLGGNK